MKESPAERQARLRRLADKPDAAIDFSDIPELTAEEFGSMRVSRGGSRPGAGRKPTGHVRIGLSLSPRAKAALERRAKKEHKTMSSIVEALLLQ